VTWCLGGIEHQVLDFPQRGANSIWITVDLKPQCSGRFAEAVVRGSAKLASISKLGSRLMRPPTVLVIELCRWKDVASQIVKQADLVGMLNANVRANFPLSGQTSESLSKTAFEH